MPLAHILAPQLIRKAHEIEAAIGPPRMPPPKTGYLQAGYEKTPYDPQGLMDKKGPQSYDSSQGDGREKLMLSLGQMQRSKDPAQEAFARGIVKGLPSTQPGGVPNTPEVMPNAPAPQNHPAVIGTTERGAPIYAGQGGPQPPTKKGKTVIQLDPNAEVGVNERGEGFKVADRNRSFRSARQGYLEKPAVVTKLGERNDTRSLARGKNDIVLQKDGSLRPEDKFGTDVLQRKYGEDFKAVEENGMKYPSGYFAGKTAKEKEDIKAGVRALQMLNRSPTI